MLDGGYTPSALSTINGQNAVDFLSQFAAVQAPGTLELNADWNQVFASPAADIQGYVAVWSGAATFYPGDTITIKLENSTEFSTQWQAVYNNPGPTGPLQTGGDFYNFFVLGYYPASFDGDDLDDDFDSSDSSSTDSPAPSASPSVVSWGDFGYIGYPQAQLSQKDLATTGGGFLTGYFLNDTSVGVLSIPSFQEFGDAIGTFSDFVGHFLARAKKAGMKKVLVDVQQNSGGDVFLAIDTFKQVRTFLLCLHQALLNVVISSSQITSLSWVVGCARILREIFWATPLRSIGILSPTTSKIIMIFCLMSSLRRLGSTQILDKIFLAGTNLRMVQPLSATGSQ